MKKQEKFNKMIEILNTYGYKAKITSEIEWGDKFFKFEIVPKQSQHGWLSARFNVQFENVNDKYKFFVALNIKDKGLIARDRDLMIKFWNNAEELCTTLNKLNIPYISEFEGEEGLIEYMKKAYKNIGQRFTKN